MSLAIEQPILLAPVDSPESTSISSPSPTPAFSIMAAPNTAHPFGSSSPANLGVPTFIATSESPSPSIDGSRSRSPFIASDTPNGEPESPTATDTATDIDPQILEALRSKDRLYVLKLGELMEGLINDRRARIDLTPATSYQRLLVHRCAAYYRLSPESDPASKGIIALLTMESRIPARRLCELVPAEPTAQPAFKIMRRTLADRRPKTQSRAGSIAGEDADFSDVEPSESGSLGGRSNATGGSGKKRMTIEEREAAYNEARSRIFMGFEEKEKEKEKDMSASSSSLSLVSGSASTSGGGGSSSTGDLDDSVSSPATESEWSGPSGPVTRDKQDGRHGSGNASVASSSRSLRSTAPPFNANGSGSSRGSRASSPAFTYASLYEPPSSVPSYDATHPGQVPGSGYMASPYIYPYPPPGQPPNPPFLAPYQFFTPYNPYQPPLQHPQPNNSDNSAPSGGEMYPQSQQIGYGNPYVWPHPNQPPLPHPQMQQHPQPPSQPRQNLNNPPGQNAPQYSPYMAPTSYPPPMPGYYPPQPGQHVTTPPPNLNAQPMYEISRSNGNVGPGMGNAGSGSRSVYGNGNGAGSISHSRTSSSNSAPPGVANGAVKRGIPQPRAPWSFGPGVGMGGHGYNGAASTGGMGGGEVVGPRLSSMRRPSGNSVGSSGTNRSSSNCDESSSTASSSTTSSSSRRTYTSTSSQHPLPPRPDWAVGLKPQPMLHSNHNRHHDHSLTNSRNVSPISPPRNLNGGSPNSNASLRQQQSQQMPPVLRATDFPPLTSLSSTPEKRTPVVGGVWTNSSSMRSILMPSPGHSNTPGSALVLHPSSSAGVNNNNNARLEEPDRGFERPPPKGATELFNPKVVRRPTSNSRTNPLPHDKVEKEKERARGDAVANAILVGQIGTMSLEDHQAVEGSSVTAPAAKETSALVMST